MRANRYESPLLARRWCSLRAVIVTLPGFGLLAAEPAWAAVTPDLNAAVRWEGLESPTGATTRAWFGSSFGGAGDVDGDGLDDLLVGAELTEDEAGRAYLFLGDSDGMDGTPAATLLSFDERVWFGGTVNGAGDLDGDGLAELAVESNHPPDEGNLYLYLVDVYSGGDWDGGSGEDWSPTITLSSEDHGTSLGVSIEHGDFDGDGLEDLALSSATNDSSRGRIAIFWGDSAGLSEVEGEGVTYLDGEEESGNFGSDLAPLGDLDGDDADDLGVGSRLGSVYLLFGSPERAFDRYAREVEPVVEGTIKPLIRVAPYRDGDQAGVLVGSHQNDAALRGALTGFLFTGDFADPFGDPVFELTGQSLDEELRDDDASESGLGDDQNIGDPGTFDARADWDGDGAVDVFLGLPEGSQGRLFGLADASEAQGRSAELARPAIRRRLYEPASSEGFAEKASYVGDLDGDGLQDLAIGARDAHLDEAETEGATEGAGQVIIAYGAARHGLDLGPDGCGCSSGGGRASDEAGAREEGCSYGVSGGRGPGAWALWALVALTGVWRRR